MPHLAEAARTMAAQLSRLAEAERTPGQGWSERGFLQIAGIALGIAILVVAIRSIFGKK